MCRRRNETVFWLLSIFVSGSPVAQAPSDKLVHSLEGKVTGVAPSGNLEIDVTNSSNMPIKIWKETGSLGAARWCSPHPKGTVGRFFQHPNRNFTKNRIAPVEISSGGHIAEPSADGFAAAVRPQPPCDVALSSLTPQAARARVPVLPRARESVPVLASFVHFVQPTDGFFS